MRKQQAIWQKEHRKAETWPSLGKIQASSSVVYFQSFLKKHYIHYLGKALDIGCGKGRNAVYLAKKGYEVYAMDYVQQALKSAYDLAKKEGVLHKIHFIHKPIDSKWPFSANFFDIAIDCYSSIDIETVKGRKIYKYELWRTLKPEGFALATVVSEDDELEKEMMKISPGSEKNSVIWPNGKFQKNYDWGELMDFYCPPFAVPVVKRKRKKAFKLGKNYIARNYWIILQKLIP